MPVSMRAKGVWFAGAVVALVVLVVAGLPLVASTQIVRDGIAYQMSAWTGYRVRLDDRPEIHVWPTFGAVLNDVTLLNWSETDPEIVLQAERIETELSALAALRGEVVFTEMRLIRPVLRLREEGSRLHLAPPQSWGRIARSVTMARDAVAAAPSEPDTSALPSDTFGTIAFSEGRIVSPQGDVVTNLTGTFNWPALNRQASVSASGTWRGENATLKASSMQPLILLGGGSAPLNISLKAAPAEVSFSGTASLSGTNFVDGQLTMAAPSLGELVEWTHSLVLPASDPGAVEMSARMVGNAERLKFENTSLNLENSAGTGLLDVTFGEAGPLIAGTLAFDTLDLHALVDTFGPFSSSPLAARAPPIEGRDFDFDLRFSAVNATYGAVTLTDVAAAAKVKDGLATFDISDATTFGGTMQLSMRANRTSKDDSVEMRMVGEEIDMAGLATALGYRTLMPRAHGAFSVVLKGTGRDFETVLQNAKGNISATFGKGSVPGLSLDAFFEKSAEGDFFPLAAIEEGALQIDGAEMKASVANGVAQLEKAEVRSGQYTISLDGLVPFAGRALALYGTLAAPESTDPRINAPLIFFVGGSWKAPYIASTTRPAVIGGTEE